MIRVIYKWKVEEGDVSKFKKAWKEATTTIKNSVQGARGSILLRDYKNITQFITMARWDSFDDWQSFWNGPTPVQMKAMHELAERLSVECHEEIEDFTV